MLVKLVNPSPHHPIAGFFESEKQRGKQMKKRHHRRHRRHNPGSLVLHSGHKRRHRGLLRLRRNPFNMVTVKKVALSSLGAGAVAGATLIGMDEAFARVQFLSGITGYKRAAAQAGLGILGALALQSFGLETLAAGIGIGGVVTGVNTAYVQYKTTTAGGAVYAPRHLPAGQAAMQPQMSNCYSFAAK